MAEGESVSVWFGPDDLDLLEELDELEGNRSEHIKRAVFVYLGARRAGMDIGTDERNTKWEMMQWVRSMLIDYERRHERTPGETERRLLEHRDRSEDDT